MQMTNTGFDHFAASTGQAETLTFLRKQVDSFLLIKKGDRWYIVAVTNELPSKENPIPEELRN